jgi:hypothetical protein
MLAVVDESYLPPIDDLGGVIIVLFCLGLIAMGRDNGTVNAVLFAVIGRMFGKYQRKTGRR